MSWRITPSYDGLVSDADANAYLAAVQAADGQLLEPAVRIAVNNFIVGCKADGNWSKITTAGILAGARTLNGFLVPLKGNAPTNVEDGFVQADCSRSLGLKGSLSTVKSLNISWPGDVLDNVSFGFYLVEPSTSSATDRSYMAGSVSARINPNNIVRVQDNLNSSFSGMNTAPGLKAGLRDPSRVGTKIAYTGGQENTVSQAASATLGTTIRLFSRVASSTGAQVDAQISFYWAGEYLNASLLESRVATLMSDLAAAAI
jgi:hypothetical protein